MTSASILFDNFKKEYPKLLAVLPGGLASDAPPTVIAYGKMKSVFNGNRDLLWRAKNGTVTASEVCDLFPEAPRLEDNTMRAICEAMQPIAGYFYAYFEKRDGVSSR